MCNVARWLLAMPGNRQDKGIWETDDYNEVVYMRRGLATCDVVYILGGRARMVMRVANLRVGELGFKYTSVRILVYLVAGLDLKRC